jgi:hypothetical protein
MGNDSSTGGTLSSVPPFPLDDDALDAVFQQLIVAITELDGSLVRPRWQPTVPTRPEPSVNWCAIGVLSSTADDGPFITYDPATDSGPYSRHETLDVLASFYGPFSKTNAALLRDGIAVPQNTEFLNQFAMRYVSCGSIRNLPEFVNQQWNRRQDISITFRRKIDRTYAIKNLVSGVVHLFDDTGAVDRTIIVPPGATVEQ